MRFSPRDPLFAQWRNYLCVAELGLRHFDGAIDEGNKAIEAGYRPFVVYAFLAAAYALKGDVEKGRTALAEARRLNPKLSVKWVTTRYANIPALAEGLRKAGLPEE